MKTHSFQLLLCFSVLFGASSCDQDRGLATPPAGMPINLDQELPPHQGLSLESDFSRAFAINNSGAIAGSVRNAEGTIVAFKLRNNQTWYSGEEVAPNGAPEIRFAINDRGDVAGHKLIPGGIAPVVWVNGQAHDLQILPGQDYGEVFGINASGQMVGECLTGNWVAPTTMRATVFSLDGATIDLGTLGGDNAAAVDINDRGNIVGLAQNALGQFHAFFYKDGVMQDLGTLGGTISNANAINNRDEVVGRSLLANGAIRAFHYDDGVMTDLGTLGGAASVAFDINDRGEIVGFSRISNGQARAFLYKDGVMQDLGALGGTDSRALGINNHGDITGHWTDSQGNTRGFLYRNGVMMSL